MVKGTKVHDGKFHSESSFENTSSIFKVSALKNASSSYVQNMMDNMILTSQSEKSSLSQA